MSKLEDLTGQKFGRLKVIEYMGLDESRKRTLWKCKCECGKEIVTRKDSLKNGRTFSCGCLAKEKRLEANTKHGLADDPLHKIWLGMIHRCTNPDNHAYESYGGRGIKAHEKWLEFDGFNEDMRNGHQKGLSLERKNVNGDYSPDNCKWATAMEQANNKRNNHIISVFGEEMTVAEAARKYGIKYNTLSRRILTGMSPEKAVTEPVRGSK